MKRKWLFLLLVVLAETSAQYNPLKDPNICGRPKCDNANRKFHYKPGVKYKYQYSVDVDTLFEGTSKNSSSLHIDADLVLEFTGHCEGTLTFSALRLSERENEGPDHEHTSLFSDAITKNPLRFSYHDGIVTELCPKEEETNWVLNFKRGVLTLLHNSMRRFDLDHEAVESDVHGTCPTKYTLEGARNTSLIIQKTKDIANCNDRYKHHSILQTTPYSFRANYQVIPIIKSNVTCELSIDHHIYNRIVCHESHMFQPFSYNAAGAATVARQKLELVRELEQLGYEEPPPDVVERRTNLLFNHVPSPKPTSGELRESRDLIKKLCKLSTDEMQIEFSDLFTKFIHTSRQLSNIALHQLYNRARLICATGKKHILDALPFLGSNAAVTLMKDIIIDGSVPQDTVNDWLLAMSFIPRPNENMLVSLIDLLQHNTANPAVTLTIATVAHSYCRVTSNCHESEPLQEIIAELEKRARENYNRRNDGKETRDKMLVALKGIANIGIVSEDFEHTLWDMIMDDELSAEVRVAAVDAHRRLPCLKSRGRFLDLFRNQKLDSEVRIAMYLQMMRCPDYITIRIVRHSLQEEEVNQVGSFIWSHLHNLMKSSIPSRIEIQTLLADKDLGRKFSSDIRKFSHNYEGSLFFDEYNAGGNYEANVIFSPSSYIPKSAMFNMTLDIFGESMNLFEINGRSEGLEHYLESLFGPKAPLNTQYFEKKLSKIRWPRSASSANENEVLKSDIDHLPDIVSDKFHDPRVTFGMKVFGNELKYVAFNGDAEIKDALGKVNPNYLLKRILSGKEITYNKASMILDTSYVVPCGAGLPLTLNAVGTAAINLKMFGSLKVLDTMEFDLVGSLRPSVTVDVIGSMSVDAFYANTGIKLKTNVYSSSAIESQIKVRNTKLVSVKFSLPKEKTEIFSAHSEIVIMRNNIEEYQRGITEKKISKTLCSWPVMDRTIGLKLCADYNFANVTKNNKAPYFILAGPANFRVSLQKADPTAKNYVFEYKWTKVQNTSLVTVSFDTPGASVRRLLNANMTLDTESKNLTLLLESAAGTTVAKGRYKNTDTEKYLYLSLDVNGKKHFDVGMSLNKKESKNGFIYQPRFYLGVNNERVAQLNGTVKYIMKKGIQQWEVSVDFNTKRLDTHLAGYVTRSDAAFSTKLNLDYRFLNDRKERIHTEFKISNRSTNTIRSFHGDLRLKSTAYPQFNFDASLKYQTAQGHVDCKLLVNSKPHLNDPEHILTAQFVFITTDTSGGRKMNTFIEVSRPVTELDVKLQFRYETAGPKTNVFLLCRYAKDRDISVALYLSTPHGSLFFLEGKLNVTIPSFIPMILEGKLQEKTSNKYDIELKAVWFSGHNCTISGRYEEKSTRIATSRNVKMLIQSPSFHEINLVGSYYRDQIELNLNIKADHGEDIYGVFLKHSAQSVREIYTKAEIIYKGKEYSINSIVNLQEDRQIRLEIHIDSVRDIHLIIRGLTKEARKELGIEIKWDVNRDPDQKLVVSFEFANPQPYHYNGNMLLAWPGRSIGGKFGLKLQDYHFESFGRLAWSPTEFIRLKLGADYKYEVETLITLESELLTPFENWKKTSINGGYHHVDNMYRVNGSVYWLQNQHVSVNVFSNYTSRAEDLRCEFAGSVLSTIPKVPSVSGNLKHFYNDSKIDTSFNVTYDPKKMIYVKSVWEIVQDDFNKNFTGNMRLLSPFAGYNHGVLVSKICVNGNRDIRGIADLDLDYKKYTASLEGHLQRVTESMFYFNVTTPIEKYNKLTGRFGLSERKRHIVAEVRAPAGAVGAEVLFFITDISDFDIKFALATPVDFLRNAMLVAKLKSDRADFRLGWNNLTAGFTGVWYYLDLTDFEYSYKIYTPIDRLEENGIVAKFELADGLDSEFTVKLMDRKVGIAIVGKPKPKLLKELGVKRPPIYTSNQKIHESEEHAETEADSQDGISWNGLIELDTIIWPTIKGTLDLDQAGPVYAATVTLTLPDGVAEMTNVLEFEDMLNMRNELHLVTPYECYKEITSNLNIDIILGLEYNVALDFNVLNKTHWIETGALVHYVHEDEEDEIEIHNGTLHIHTPFVTLPRLDLNAALELEENVSRIALALLTNRSDISFYGSGEADDGFLETSATFQVFSPSLYIPRTEFKLKKDFSKAENILEVLLNVTRTANTKYKVKSLWHVRSMKHFKIELKTELPIHPLEHIEAGIAVLGESEVKSAALRLILPPHSLDANATMKDNLVHAVLMADLAADKHAMNFDGNIVKISDKQHSLSGVLKYGEENFDVSGNMNMYNDLPAGMDLELVPKNGGEIILARYSIQPQESGFALRSKLQRGKAEGHVEAHVGFRHKFDWDIHVQVDTPLEHYKTATVHARMATPNVNNMSFLFESNTPFQGLEHTKIGYTLLLQGISGDLRLFHELANTKGATKVNWQWLLMENMSLKLIGDQQIGSKKKTLALVLFYVNPNKKFEFLKFGGDIDVDNGVWTFGSNATLSLPSHYKIDLDAHLKLPLPTPDVHSVIGHFYSTEGMKQVQYLANYRTSASNQFYAASGNVSVTENTNVKGNLKVDWGLTANQSINNILDLKRSNRFADVEYRLITAKYLKQDTLKTRMTYIGNLAYHNVTAQLFLPACRQIADVKVDFSGLPNMNGTLNVTTPFQGFPYAGAHFVTETKSVYSNRRVEAFWPNNTALLDSKYKYVTHKVGHAEANGLLVLDVPFTTRHVTKVEYGYTTKPLHTTGKAIINYNTRNILEGTYKCDSVSRAGFDKDVTNIEVENSYVPVGLLYIHQFDYNAPGGGSNLPTMDFKHVEVFNLRNKTGFNVTGEIQLNTTASGKQISIQAISLNRTVTLDTDYDVQDQRFLQNSRLQLAPTVWIAYDLDIVNKTEDGNKEHQEIEINVSYPRRNFTLLGSYAVTNRSLFSEASLTWDRAVKTKVIQASLEWERLSVAPNHQLVEFKIMHPSFQKNVSFKGEYLSNDRKIADAQLTVVYSHDPDKKLYLAGILEDHSNDRVRNFTFEVSGSHPATNLELLVKGRTDFRRRWYHGQCLSRYQRTYLPLQMAELFGKLDLDRNEIEYEKKTEREPAYLWAKYDGVFPVYTANMSAWKGYEYNASGKFYVNFKEKLLQTELNMTEDGSQSFHMYGVIPDARSATFNIWRDYEDIHVSDVAYYLRLNHSRLVVSSLNWRPELKAEIKAAIRVASIDLYNNLTTDLDYWKTYIRSETVDAVKDVWENAKPDMQNFLDDIDGLKLLVDDIEVLKKFLNASYYANEFYVRDIVAGAMYVIDELSIRSHIESLPAIVNEIWEVMGESGKAIRKSVHFIVQTIKESYRKAAEFINSLLRGEFLEHLSKLMDRFVEKYDKFVKDIHVWFMKYMEELWQQVYMTAVDNWRKMLRKIEPAFITFAHYVETTVYSASKEVLDFLYKHTSEIVESPYFHKFSRFTQDLDKFYKDITQNDIITVIYKYSNIVINFLREKYSAMVPFGKELQDIVTEIINELQELRKLPSIQYVTAKVEEWFNKVKWFYDYFDVGYKLRRFITIVHAKLTDITLTALQAENRYREAKTNFIFEPKTGTMHLEQKLPMSWHAFNETPRFEEIPEYKALSDIHSYFVSSNITFWALYYDYKPYADPKDWFPPFTAHAMVAGSQHYMTFDKQFYEFSGSCSYLLAHDFLDQNFSMAIAYDPATSGRTHKLHLLLKDTAVIIDVFANTVAVGNSTVGRLPVVVEDAYIYRDADMLTVQSMSGFSLKCNMKFDVCMVDVAGWYFGKTAGLWGTINNEPSDDFTTSTNEVVPHIGRFTQSWSLRPDTCRTTTNQAVTVSTPDPAVVELCNSLFTSNVSPFNVCFQRVHANPFHRMCLNSGSEMHACISAVAYIQACRVDNTPLRIPDVCVKCNLPNGTEVNEGEFVKLQNEDIPLTSDVVFIVEAKACNDELKKKRNLDLLVSLIQKELVDSGITNNRYSVVVFGGNNVFDKPRSIVVNNEIFASHQQIPSYFDDIPIGNGSSDIFGAINFGSQLVFRPGASKTFIILPCTDCNIFGMKLDYAVLHQLLLENDITLHILMNGEFYFEKERISKAFFGIDSNFAYTKSDGRTLKGDAELRRQVRPPKSILGYCAPLALETNGTVFTAKKLEDDKRNSMKKFGTVFAKRVAKTAVPSACQTCECNALDNGVSFMECFPCHYPTPAYSDYDFNDYEILSTITVDNDDQYDSAGD